VADLNALAAELRALQSRWRGEAQSDDQSSEYECGEHVARQECADEINPIADRLDALAREGETECADGGAHEWLTVCARCQHINGDTNHE
jgi:hypothetical protein